MKTNKSKDLVTTLIEATKRTDEWTVTQYRAKHTPSGTSLWIANGVLYLNHDNESRFPLSLSMVARFRIWPHIRQLKDVKVIEAINRATAAK